MYKVEYNCQQFIVLYRTNLNYVNKNLRQTIYFTCCRLFLSYIYGYSYKSLNYLFDWHIGI